MSVSAEETSAPVFSATGARLAGIDAAALSPHRFGSPAPLSEADLRALGELHQLLAKRLSARLSMFLRMDCMVIAGTGTSVRFSEHLARLTEPALVTLFQAEPWRGLAYLDMDPGLALAIADRSLGGKGRVGGRRLLTEIEQSLYEDAANLFLAEWGGLWSGVADLKPAAIGHETNPNFLQAAADESVIVAPFTITLGESNANFSFIVPHAMLEGALRQMREAKQRTPKPATRTTLRPSYNSLRVPLVAEWDVREITVQDAISLTVGSVIELSPELIATTQVRIGGKSHFIGTVGTDNGRVAVEITSTLS